MPLADPSHQPTPSALPLADITAGRGVEAGDARRTLDCLRHLVALVKGLRERRGAEYAQAKTVDAK